MSQYRVAVVGVGMVGTELVRVLRQRNFPCSKLQILARRARTETIDGNSYEVLPTTAEAFSDIDIALFAGTEGEKGASQLYGWEAVRRGAIVVDNGADFRLEPNVPLVVPEVNADALKSHQGFIANPNCSTIQMVIALAPIHKVNRIKRVVVTTFQSVSGTGLEAIEILEKQAAARLAGKPLPKGVYEHPIGFNLFPHIDKYQPDGLYLEETKMVLETQKIMGAKIPVCPTTVRVPVFYCHSEAVNLALSKPMTADRVRKLLAKAPGVVVCDEPARAKYPTPLLAQDTDDVYVGRIRNDPSQKNGINLFVVADNLRVGAATNAVRIYQEMCRQGLL